MKNTFKTIQNIEVDELTVDVHRLNVEAVQGMLVSTLFLHTDIGVALVRPIYQNKNIPDIDVSFN